MGKDKVKIQIVGRLQADERYGPMSQWLRGSLVAVNEAKDKKVHGQSPNGPALSAKISRQQKKQHNTSQAYVIGADYYTIQSREIRKLGLVNRSFRSSNRVLTPLIIYHYHYEVCFRFYYRSHFYIPKILFRKYLYISYIFF